MLYVKRPIVIEAFELDDHFLNWPQWAHDALTENKIKSFNMGKFRDNSESYVLIQTLEGEMKGSVGDFIIRGIKGEIYPCKNDIFHITYQEIK